MTAKELQERIEAARGTYTPGKRMDQYQDQDILAGIVDGLGGDQPRTQDSHAWAEGIRIGMSLRKALG